MADIRETGKKDNIYIGVLATLGVILIVVAVMYYMEHRENKRYISEITTEKINLENELSMLSQNYDSLQTSNDTLNVQLRMEQEKISDLLERMKVFRNNSYAEINKYKRETRNFKRGTAKLHCTDRFVKYQKSNSYSRKFTCEKPNKLG